MSKPSCLSTRSTTRGRKGIRLRSSARHPRPAPSVHRRRFGLRDVQPRSVELLTSPCGRIVNPPDVAAGSHSLSSLYEQARAMEDIMSSHPNVAVIDRMTQAIVEKAVADDREEARARERVHTSRDRDGVA
jgi:hypothetical protein